MYPGTQTTPGGISTNSYMQAVTTEGRIIPNLYVVGEAANGTATPFGLWSGSKATAHILFT